MRTYVVQPGDSPARIAARDDMAGCPKCARDLVAVNAKPALKLPNGYRTFRALRPGELINIPSKWSSSDFDRLPSEYFASLPHPDGATRPFAVSGPGDLTALDAASDGVIALAQAADAVFASAVDGVAAAIDSAVLPATLSSDPRIAALADAVHIATGDARQRSAELVVALQHGDAGAIAKARLDIQNDLLAAIDAGQIALQALSVPPAPAASSGGFPIAVATAAQAAAAAMAADSNYCRSVARPGSAVNAAVHAFKLAWNASQLPLIPVNTSNYEAAAANALARVLGASPTACAPNAGAAPTSPAVSPPSTSTAVAANQSTKLSTGAVLGMGLIGAGVVGGAIYYVIRPRR